MKLITRQLNADKAPSAWTRQYGTRKPEITAALKALPSPIDPDEVDRIIGNKSWTSVGQCDECKEPCEVLVQLGDEPDYESATAELCHACLQKALQLAVEAT